MPQRAGLRLRLRAGYAPEGRLCPGGQAYAYAYAYGYAQPRVLSFKLRTRLSRRTGETPVTKQGREGQAARLS